MQNVSLISPELCKLSCKKSKGVNTNKPMVKVALGTLLYREQNILCLILMKYNNRKFIDNIHETVDRTKI